MKVVFVTLFACSLLAAALATGGPPQPPILMFVAFIVVLMIGLTIGAARDPNRDSTAIAKTRRDEEGAKAVYVIVQSPAEVHHYHEHNGRVRHDHRHIHVNVTADLGSDSGSFDSSRYLPAGPQPRRLPPPPRVFGIQRPQPRAYLPAPRDADYDDYA